MNTPLKPVVIAVVLQALWSLGRTAIKSRSLAALAVVSVVATAFGLNELIVLCGAGSVMVVARSFVASPEERPQGASFLAVSLPAISFFRRSWIGSRSLSPSREPFFSSGGA